MRTARFASPARLCWRVGPPRKLLNMTRAARVVAAVPAPVVIDEVVETAIAATDLTVTAVGTEIVTHAASRVIFVLHKDPTKIIGSFSLFYGNITPTKRM